MDYTVALATTLLKGINLEVLTLWKLTPEGEAYRPMRRFGGCYDGSHS